MRDGVRYQFYETSDDRHVLFMASEQEFWKNFCEGVGRPDLFEKWPGSQYGDHAKGNRELQAILRDIFLTKTAAEWLDFGDEHNTPIAAVNTPKTIAEDPQFQDRFPWLPADVLGCRPAADAAQVHRRGEPDPDQGPDRRPAHRRDPRRGARLRRRRSIAELRDAGALG